MKRIIQMEELAMTAVGILLISMTDINLDWWLYLILFFSPDIGILGYVVNRKVGAITYNIFHHKGLAITVAIAGYLLHEDYIMVSGLILFAHASFDRIFGFGLKHFAGFKYTHLGVMK